MQVESKEATANVYNHEFEGGVWVWDFGVFTLIGNENHPNTPISTMDAFSAIVTDVDHSEMEPDFITEVTFYIGDYVVYVETNYSSATHFVDPNNDLFRFETGARYEEDDSSEEMFILAAEGVRITDQIAVEVEEIKKNWVPVLKVS